MTSDILPDERLQPGRRLSRYDLLLAVIPAAFVMAVLLADLLSVPTRAALSVASVVGAVALVDGLFLNPPRGPTTR